MPDDPFYELPSEIIVRADDVIAVIKRLESALERLEERRSPFAVARELDELVGLLTRWLWPLLGELDEEEDL